MPTRHIPIDSPAARTAGLAARAASPDGFAPDILQRAVSYWVAQSEHGSDDGSSDTHAALSAWRAENPEHERAWQHLQAVSRRLHPFDASAERAPQSHGDTCPEAEKTTRYDVGATADDIHSAQRRASLSALSGADATKCKSAIARRRAFLKTSCMVVGFGTAGFLLTRSVRDGVPPFKAF